MTRAPRTDHGVVLAFGMLLAGCAHARSEPLSAANPLESAPAREVTPEGAALEAARRAVQRAEGFERVSRRQAPCSRWPAWEAYANHFISDDGRVIDHTDGARTTSEGQAYGAFFALVANDRERFQRLLRWTEANLAQGSLEQHLPAWLWGKRADGSFGVLDRNAASDADVWLAYALLEAARLWDEPGFARLGHALAEHVARLETADIPGLGHVLLPGPHGFVDPSGKVRLNPSYLVLPLFRGLEASGVAGPWSALIASSARILAESAPSGLAPDWITYQPGLGFRADDAHGPLGSYDAIRVYLWSSLLPTSEPHGAAIRNATAGFVDLVRGARRVPERIDVRSGEFNRRRAPPGFIAVALLAARDVRDDALAAQLYEQLESTRHGGLYGEPPAYYDQNLALFALGFLDGKYAFEQDGRLLPHWNREPCDQT